MTRVGQLTQVVLTEKKNTHKESKAKARTSRRALEGVRNLWDPLQGVATVGPCGPWPSSFFWWTGYVNTSFDFILFHRAGFLGLSQPWRQGGLGV